MKLRRDEVVVAGVGNPLAGDDAIGVAVVEELSRRGWLEGVDKISMETLGLRALPQLEGYRAVVFVDAADIGLRTGEWAFLRGEEFEKRASLFSHDIGLVDVMHALRLISQHPPFVYVFAVQGENYGFGREMSEKLKQRVEYYAAELVKLVERMLEDS